MADTLLLSEDYPAVQGPCIQVTVDGAYEIIHSPFNFPSISQALGGFFARREVDEFVGIDTNRFINQLFDFPVVEETFKACWGRETELASQNHAAPLRKKSQTTWHRAASAMPANSSPPAFAQDTPTSSAASSPHPPPTTVLRLKGVKRVLSSPERTYLAAEADGDRLELARRAKESLVVEDSDEEEEGEDSDDDSDSDADYMDYADPVQLKQAIMLTRTRLNFLCECLKEALDAQGIQPPAKKTKVSPGGGKKGKKH